MVNLMNLLKIAIIKLQCSAPLFSILFVCIIRGFYCWVCTIHQNLFCQSIDSCMFCRLIYAQMYVRTSETDLIGIFRNKFQIDAIPYFLMKLNSINSSNFCLSKSCMCPIPQTFTCQFFTLYGTVLQKI